MAQAIKKEEQIRKMATLAKAEKAELMTQTLKERDNSSEGSDKVGSKRTYE